MQQARKLLLLLCALFVVGCSDNNTAAVLTDGGSPSLAIIQVTPLGKAIARGTTIQLTATGVFTNGVSANLSNTTTWSSSNTAVATVTNTGLVTGIAPGEVTITASTSGINGTTPLTVTAATLTNVTVSPLNASVARGTTQQFRLTGGFTDGSTQDLTSAASWTTSPTTLASVNNLGLATATNVGTANVTATFGGLSASGNLTATAATLQSITVLPAGPAVARGFSVQAGANGTFSDGSVQNITNTVTWTSGDDTVANVSAAGNVSANNVGVVNITATSGAIVGRTPVSVTQATLVSLALNPAAPYNLTQGDVTQLQATGSFSDGTTLDLTSAATWLSNNTAVAEVTNAAPVKGTLTARSAGVTQLLAAIPNTTVNATATVNVSLPVALQANLVAVDGSGTNLLSFSSSAPGTVTTTAITGLNIGETLVGLDVRPQNRFLYGLGFNSGAGTVQLYTINPSNGVATALGASGVLVDAGSNPISISGQFGFDFNPSVDRIRVVTSTGLNFRMNPNTGAFVDGDLGGAAGSVAGLNPDGPINGGTTTVDGAAYTNNQPNNGSVTTLYNLDGTSNSLFIQNPPNAGTQTLVQPVTLNGSTLDFTSVNGFDIAPGVNAPSSNAAVTAGSGFAALQVGGTSSLFAINLTNGSALNLGTIGTGATAIRGLAVLHENANRPAIGITAGPFLTRFSVTTPGTTTTVSITGIAAGETLAGIDFRPATGQLFGFAVNPGTDTGTVYIIDPQTGAATIVGTAGQVAFVDASATAIDLPDPANVGYGFDFNPTVDRLRVTTNSGLNFRLNPNNGAPVDGNLGVAGVNPDGNINGLPGGSTGVAGAAYTNSAAGATVTTLYTIDSASGQLSIQNPPNNGTQVAVGTLGVTFTSILGFDIPSSVTVGTSNAVASGNGLAVLNVGGTVGLFSINLTTGAATNLGAFASGLTGLALGN